MNHPVHAFPFLAASFTASLAASLALASCSGVDPRYIHNEREFAAANRVIEEKAVPALAKAAQGLPIDQADRKNLQTALTEAKRILAFDPGNLQAYNVVGKIQKALGQYEEALRTFEDGLALARRVDSPDFRATQADVISETAVIHIAARRFSQAQAALEAALQLAPGNPLYLTDAARLALVQGDKPRARKLAQAALQADPDFTPAQLTLRAASQ